jgi:hypothetical protein
MRSTQIVESAWPSGAPLGAEIGEDGGGAGNASGLAGMTGAQLFCADCAGSPIVGACRAAVVAGETQRLELAMNGAGAKAHGSLPLKVSLPLSDSYIAVQHKFGNEHRRDPALRHLHGYLHNLFTLMIF